MTILIHCRVVLPVFVLSDLPSCVALQGHRSAHYKKQFKVFFHWKWDKNGRAYTWIKSLVIRLKWDQQGISI